MTTTVVIKAHCASTKQVQVKITDGENLVDNFVVQDGETAERVVFDEREITVREVLK